MTTSAENWSMEELSSVSIDDEKAGETIVDYLIEHGHTKIAEIGANLELSQTARLRHNGYLNSLKSMESHLMSVTMRERDSHMTAHIVR